MQAAESPSSQRATKAQKPRVIYLDGAPSTVDSAQLGANMDIRLFSCPRNARVIEGGIVASDLTVDVQGSYIGENRREFGNVDHRIRGENEIGAAVRPRTQALQHVGDIKLGVEAGGAGPLDHARRQIDADEMIDRPREG